MNLTNITNATFFIPTYGSKTYSDLEIITTYCNFINIKFLTVMIFLFCIWCLILILSNLSNKYKLIDSINDGIKSIYIFVSGFLTFVYLVIYILQYNVLGDATQLYYKISITISIILIIVLLGFKYLLPFIKEKTKHL